MKTKEDIEDLVKKICDASRYANNSTHAHQISRDFGYASSIREYIYRGEGGLEQIFNNLYNKYN
jgi:hypothetical protein